MTGVFRWMPTESQGPGSYPVTVRVTDDGTPATSDSQTFTVTVRQLNIQPNEMGTVDFAQVSGLDPSHGDLWYRFTVAREGMLTVNVSAASGSVTASLYTSPRTVPALTVSDAVTGRLDYPVQDGQTYLLRVSGDSADAQFVVTNLVAVDGAEVHVFGTTEDDEFEFAPTGSYQIMINGVEYHFDDTQYEKIFFNGGDGDDTVKLTGGPDTEVARFFPDNGTFEGNGFLVTVEEVTSITAYGGGGTDSAFMYDSPGDDQFYALQDYGRMTGDGFALETFDFMFNYGYATTRDGGNDVAYLEDTPGGDKFKFDWPKPGQFFGKMYGGGVYYNRAKNFEQIEAVMTDGKNLARLFDSEGDDTLFTQKEESRMTGPCYDVTVSGYNTFIAYASQGNDIAYLEDSDDDDTTRARPHKVVLWGEKDKATTYEITARKFDEYHFEKKHAGYDRAKLHDTALTDHAIAEGNSAALYLNDNGLDLLYEVVAFDWVKLYGTDGGDQNTIEKEDPLDFDLLYSDELWDELL